MSTAVLEGCGLQDWVAADEHSYVQLALQAANLHQLRNRRAHWRNQIQSSLGDANSLMMHLGKPLPRWCWQRSTAADFLPQFPVYPF